MFKFSRRPRAYLAAPLFNEMERDFNRKVESLISPFIDVFLPQRDGGLLATLIKNGTPLKLAKQYVFKKDIDAIANSDIIIAVLDGRTIDEGVAFELGYGHALGKICIGLKTDDRTLQTSGDNPMITESCQKIVTSESELLDSIRLPFEFFLSTGRNE